MTLHHDAGAIKGPAHDTPDQAVEKVTSAFRNTDAHEAVNVLRNEYSAHAQADPGNFKQWAADTSNKLKDKGLLPDLAFEYGSENYNRLKNDNGSMYASLIQDKGIRQSDALLGPDSALKGSALGEEKFSNTMMHELADRIKNGSSWSGDDPSYSTFGSFSTVGLGFRERYTDKDSLDKHVKGFQDKLKEQAATDKEAEAERAALSRFGSFVEPAATGKTQTLQDFISNNYGDRTGDVTKKDLDNYLDAAKEPNAKAAYPKAFSDANQKFVKDVADNWSEPAKTGDPQVDERNRTISDALKDKSAAGIDGFTMELKHSLTTNGEGEVATMNKGDSLWPLTQKWGVSTEEIKNYNEEKQHLWSDRFGKKADQYMKKDFVLEGWQIMQPDKAWVEKYRSEHQKH